MSTRSITKFYDEYEDEYLVTMYRHMDGYVSGHGKDLLSFLSGFKVVNGIGIDNPDKIANGMGCLAAQAIAHFKDGPGGVYIVSPQYGSEEYEYGVKYNKDTKQLEIQAKNCDEIIFDWNTLNEFESFVNNEENTDE